MNVAHISIEALRRAIAGATGRYSLSILPGALALAVFCSVCASERLVSAGSGIWSATTSGNYSTGGNWVGNNVADGVGAIADFSTVNIVAGVVVTLDSNRTLGQLYLGDTNDTHGWTFDGTSTLTLNNGAMSPVIRVDNRTTTLGFPISISNGLIKEGLGNVQFAGNTTLTGALTINLGALQIGGTSSLPNIDSVTIKAGGTLQLNNVGSSLSSDRLADSIPLSISGGTLSLLSNDPASVPITETVGHVTLGNGTSRIDISRTNGTLGAHLVQLTIDGITRTSNATLNFTTAGSSGVIGGAAATQLRVFINGQATGFMGGWVTMDSGDFATYDPSVGVTALTGTTKDINSSGSYIAFNGNDAANLRTLTADRTINTLAMTASGAGVGVTADLNGHVLTIDSGGLLRTTQGGVLGQIIGAAGSALTAGPGGGYNLYVYMNTTGAGTTSIDVPIINNGANAVTLYKSGPARLTLTNSGNSYSGGTVINEGELVLAPSGGGNALGSGPITWVSGNLVLSSDGMSLNHPITMVAGHTAPLLLQNTTATAVSLSGPVSMAARDVTLDVTNAAGSDIFSGVVSASGTLQKTGAGAVNFSNPNSTFSGSLLVSGGTLSIAANSLNLSKVTMTAGTLNLGSAPSGVFTLGDLSGGAAIVQTGGGASGTLILNSTSDASYGGAFNGSLALIKRGPGVLTLSNTTQTYTGTTRIEGGGITLTTTAQPNGGMLSAAGIEILGSELKIVGATQANSNAFDRINNATPITMKSGLLTVQGVNNSTATNRATDEQVGVLTLQPGQSTICLIVTNNGAASTDRGVVLRLSGGGAGDSLVRQSGATLLVKGHNLGTATLATTPFATNSVSGLEVKQHNDIMTNGMIPYALADATNSGSGTSFATYNANNGIQVFTSYAGTTNFLSQTLTYDVTAPGGMTLSTDGFANSMRLAVSGSNLTLNPGITLALGDTDVTYPQPKAGILSTVAPHTISGGTLLFNSGNGKNTEAIFHTVTDLAVSSQIAGAGGLTKSSAGKLTLSNSANSYSGDTWINAGTLESGSNNSLGNTDVVHLSNVAGAQWNLNGFTQTVKGLDGGGANGGNILLGAGTLTVNNSSNATYAGVISGAGNLIKQGSGKLILTGDNTYGGGTSIGGGTLQIDGNYTGDVTVNSPGKLGGNGDLTGTLTVNPGGTVAPGASIGQLDVIGNSTISGALEIEVNGAGAGSSDLLTVTGILDISAATLSVVQLGTLDDPVYVFASYGTLAGSSPFASVPSIPGYQVDYNYNNLNQIALVVAVPEPATFALAVPLVLGLGMLVRRRRLLRAGK